MGLCPKGVCTSAAASPSWKGTRRGAARTIIRLTLPCQPTFQNCCEHRISALPARPPTHSSCTMRPLLLLLAAALLIAGERWGADHAIRKGAAPRPGREAAPSGRTR